MTRSVASSFGEMVLADFAGDTLFGGDMHGDSADSARVADNLLPQSGIQNI
ncbi:hypothetical protein [Burkholderia sp. Ac-20344]|uniref:hypothetical protein n=1 Tax=Burkholderia sp. Ac-20344 TaxID=2703890 RepID=UPI00197C0484|nr:hypothetical protein [Burkholderia sp. Ac-20344]MBN3832427.1 hypothetical protein [Burkholderia sp. Ac-20344]